MNYRFLDAASAELNSAAVFYEGHESGLGADFVREVDGAIQRLMVDPSSWPFIDSVFRRCRVNRFPYDIVFVVDDIWVVILAIAHHHRRPGYWRGRK